MFSRKSLLWLEMDSFLIINIGKVGHRMCTVIKSNMPLCPEGRNHWMADASYYEDGKEIVSNLLDKRAKVIWVDETSVTNKKYGHCFFSGSPAFGKN